MNAICCYLRVNKWNLNLSKDSVRASADFALEQVGIDALATRTWCQYGRQGHFVRCAVFLQCLEITKVTVLRSSNLSSEIHKYRLISCHALPADLRNKALEFWLATINASSVILSHALEQINAARIGVICQSASAKLPTCCLQGYFVSLRNTQGSSTCFWEAMFPTRPIALAVETSHLGDVPAQELCQAIGDVLLEQVGIDVSAPCTHESNSLDDNPAKHARMKKTRSLCVMWGLLAMFRNWKCLLWDVPISVRKSTNIALWVLVMHCLLIEETRRWNAD